MSFMKSCIVIFLSMIYSCHLIAQEIQLDRITEAKSLKRGKKYDIKWTGLNETENHQLQLYKNDELVYAWDEEPLYGVYHVKIKSRIKPGSGYRLYTVNTATEEKSIPYIVDIKRRIPLVYQTVGSVFITLSAILIYQSTRVQHFNELYIMPHPPNPDPG